MTILNSHPATRIPSLRKVYPAIIGQEVLGTETFPLVDPRTEEQFSSSTVCGVDEIDQAVQAAKAAYVEWSSFSALHRGRLMSALGRALRENVEGFASLDSLSNGRKLSECRAEAETSAAYFEYYGGLAPGIEGAIYEPLRTGVFSYQVREPYGITGHIIPWNSPLLLCARSFAPAMAAGNVIVAKPGEETPITAIELEHLAREVGVPAGVINVVPGRGENAGAALAAHPEIPRLTFTGSIDTGRLVQAGAMPRMCHVTLELGGKSPHIIFEDANLSDAVTAAVGAIMIASGQACVAGSRLLVAQEIYADVVGQLSERFRALTRSEGDEEVVAPLISKRQRDRVCGYIEGGISEGAVVAARGPESDDAGFYVAPTLFSDVRPDMAIFREEIFGPVLVVTPFASEEEAVALANATSYGLAAGMWTTSMSRAFRVVRQLEAGAVYVNGYLNTGIESPIGGYKESGLGHEKGRLAMMEYLRYKSVAISF